MKSEKFAFFIIIQHLISNIIYNILIIFILWFCLFVCFVVCNVLGHFLPFEWYSCISILWIMGFSKPQAVFNVSISKLNKTFYQRKVWINPFKVWFGSKDAKISYFWHLNSMFGNKTMSIWAHISCICRGEPYWNILFYRKTRRGRPRW